MIINNHGKKYHDGFTREKLDEICTCGHTREHHAIGLTKKGSYCFQFDNNNKPCNCKRFNKVINKVEKK